MYMQQLNVQILGNEALRKPEVYEAKRHQGSGKEYKALGKTEIKKLLNKHKEFQEAEGVSKLKQAKGKCLPAEQEARLPVLRSVEGYCRPEPELRDGFISGFGHVKELFSRGEYIANWAE